jgi:CubicO group peptidase (beta-lactamase class C family)
MRWLGALALGVALLPIAAGAAPPANCDAPTATADGWTVAAPAQEGLDPKLICAIGPVFEQWQAADPHGIVVIRHGALVYEHYFAGGDLRWGPSLGRVPHDADTLHDLRSVTKSVVGLLVGVALDRGLLKDVNSPVFSLLPEYQDLSTPGKNLITLRTLLSMSSGLDWPELAVSYNDPTNIERRMNFTPDPYRFVLEQPLAAEPGKVWNYNSGGVELIGDILTKVSGQPLDKFAKEALFDPLGITRWEWWHNGNLSAAWGLRLRPRDMAKIGQLVLDRGKWGGRQIVSAAWIDQMTAPQIPDWTMAASGGHYSYGYLWWLGRSAIDGREIDWADAVGYGGQRVFVVPSEDMVVVVTAGFFRNGALQTLVGYRAVDMALRAAVVH